MVVLIYTCNKHTRSYALTKRFYFNEYNQSQRVTVDYKGRMRECEYFCLNIEMIIFCI